MKQIKAREKGRFHPNNKHQGKYNFDKLIKAYPKLETFVAVNQFGNRSVDFFDPNAVKALNTALLFDHYEIKYWDIPEGALCPPVPGRADYIHHLADLIYFGSKWSKEKGSRVTILDIGTGASLIYPIIGNRAYNWKFVATDANAQSIKSAQSIIDKNNDVLADVSLRIQKDNRKIFRNLIEEDEYYDALICNPPFFGSEEDALFANERKNRNLGNTSEVRRNFGGMQNELWCDGGEVQFIKRIIEESASHRTLCYWYTTLVSRDDHLDELVDEIDYHDPTEIKVIDLTHGNKKSRVLCWTFLTEKQQKAWVSIRDR